MRLKCFLGMIEMTDAVLGGIFCATCIVKGEKVLFQPL